MSVHPELRQSNSSGPFRANRLRAPSLVPHSRPIISLQQTLVVDAARQGHGATTGAADGGKEDKNIRRRETIFGPDVGEDDEPGWTGKGEGVKVGVDVVKGWVEKAKSEDVSWILDSGYHGLEPGVHYACHRIELIGTGATCNDDASGACEPQKTEFAASAARARSTLLGSSHFTRRRDRTCLHSSTGINASWATASSAQIQLRRHYTSGEDHTFDPSNADTRRR